MLPSNMKNILCLLTNQIADILHADDNSNYQKQDRLMSTLSDYRTL